jgi:nicotinamide-nucleotide amidase
MDDRLHQLSQCLGEQLLQHNWRVATAESCTGGGVAAAITAISGSSAWFEYGIVSYANAAKEKLLGVSSETLAREGAVSEAVVVEIGTVWFAWVTAAGEIQTEIKLFEGNRESVQWKAVICALEGILARVKQVG